MSRRISNGRCGVLGEDTLLDEFLGFGTVLEGLIELITEPGAFQLGLLALQGRRDLGIFEDVLLDELLLPRTIFEGSLEFVADGGVGGGDVRLVEGYGSGAGVDGDYGA